VSFGSCTPRDTFIFNWRIVQAPTVVIEYVIVSLTHSGANPREFWSMWLAKGNQCSRLEWQVLDGHSLGNCADSSTLCRR
jgi:hypothetical protein